MGMKISKMGLSIAHNITLLGINNATLDGSNRMYQLEIGNMSNRLQITLRDILFVNFPRVYSNANLTLERCHFINSTFSVNDGSLIARDCTFEHGKLRSCSDDSGGLALHHVTGALTNCSFIGNDAFLNTSACNGGAGEGLVVSCSNITLIDPVIESNIAAWGGGITAYNSTLKIHGGRIMHNRALPVNHTNPVSHFGGIGGAIDAVRSKVTLDNTIISGNLARVAAAINSTKDSEIRLLGNVVTSDNREI